MAAAQPLGFQAAPEPSPQPGLFLVPRRIPPPRPVYDLTRYLPKVDQQFKSLESDQSSWEKKCQDSFIYAEIYLKEANDPLYFQERRDAARRNSSGTVADVSRGLPRHLHHAIAQLEAMNAYAQEAFSLAVTHHETKALVEREVAVMILERLAKKAPPNAAAGLDLDNSTLLARAVYYSTFLALADLKKFDGFDSFGADLSHTRQQVAQVSAVINDVTEHWLKPVIKVVNQINGVCVASQNSIQRQKRQEIDAASRRSLAVPSSSAGHLSPIEALAAPPQIASSLPPLVKAQKA